MKYLTFLRLQTTFDGKELYSDAYEKAAALVFSIIKNRPFVDGNKRTGLHAALTFLELNGKIVNIADKELVKLGLNIAKGIYELTDIMAVF